MDFVFFCSLGRGETDRHLMPMVDSGFIFRYKIAICGGGGDI